MRRLVLILAIASLAAGLAGCSSSKPTTAAPDPSGSATTAATDAGADPAAFANGLAWFFSSGSATEKSTLPDGLATCVSDKLDGADRAAIVAIKSGSDSDNAPDPLGIRVFRVTTGCDRGFLSHLLESELSLDQIGVTDATQISCVSTELIDNINALDDTTATGRGGASLTAPSASALESCVPITLGLTAILKDPSSGVPASQVSCVATEAGKTVTWGQLLAQDPAFKTALQGAAASCAAATGGG